jgi:hypothetical protein
MPFLLSEWRAHIQEVWGELWFDLGGNATERINFVSAGVIKEIEPAEAEIG